MGLIAQILDATTPSATWRHTNRQLVEDAEQCQVAEQLSGIAFRLLEMGSWTAGYRGMERACQMDGPAADDAPVPTHIAAAHPFIEQVHEILGRACKLAADEQFLEAYNLVVPELRLVPCHAGVLSTLGFVQSRRRAFDDAKPLLVRALEVDPYLPEAYNNLGFLYLLMREPAMARLPLERALELRPNYPEALNNLRILKRVFG